MTPKLTFHGATRTVTGSCFSLEIGQSRLLIDCGLYQGRKQDERNRQPFAFVPSSIDAVLLTHAHIDHSGMLPRLVRDGFKGPIYTHSATVDLARVMLADSAHIQESTQRWANKHRVRKGHEPLPPIYGEADADAAIALLKPMRYNVPMELPGTDVVVTLHDAGHILGSAFIELRSGGETIVFSGDLGNSPVPILNDPSPIPQADYVLCESTYGHRRHEDGPTKDELLAEIVRSTAKKGGSVIIPAFSVGRTQEMLYALDALQREGRIPILPIYVDSPMAINATQVFRGHPECYDAELKAKLDRDEDPFSPGNLRLSRTTEESRGISAAPGSAIVISANGMCTAGRILHHLRHNLWKPQSTILFVGYQGEGTLGRAIRDGVKEVTVFGERVRVKARIESIGGFSAHADQDGLTRWLFTQPRSPHRIFCIHGEAKSAFGLVRAIDTKWAGAGYVPEFRQSVELSARAVKELKQVPDALPVDVVRGAKTHELELDRAARELETELREFLQTASAWAKEERDAGSAAAGSREIVRRVLRRIGSMACDGAQACDGLLETATRGKKRLEEQELVDELGRLGEKLSK